MNKNSKIFNFTLSVELVLKKAILQSPFKFDNSKQRLFYHKMFSNRSRREQSTDGARKKRHG